MKAITKLIEMLEIHINIIVLKSLMEKKKRVWFNLLFTLIHINSSKLIGNIRNFVNILNLFFLFFLKNGDCLFFYISYL